MDNEMTINKGAETMARIIRKGLDDMFSNNESHITSPIMYDPSKMQTKTSFAVIENILGKDIIKRYSVTVEDVQNSWYHNIFETKSRDGLNIELEFTGTAK